MTFDIFLHLVSRFVHIGSVVLFLGGVAYARQVLVPVLTALPEDVRTKAALDSQQRFRVTLYTLLALIVCSGLYNFLTYSGPKHTAAYHMWFGIKFLLVLHLLATAILWSTSTLEKARRRLLSLTVSGFIVVLISAYLRSLSQRGL